MRRLKNHAIFAPGIFPRSRVESWSNNARVDLQQQPECFWPTQACFTRDHVYLWKIVRCQRICPVSCALPVYRRFINLDCDEWAILLSDTSVWRQSIFCLEHDIFFIEPIYRESDKIRSSLRIASMRFRDISKIYRHFLIAYPSSFLKLGVPSAIERSVSKVDRSSER